MTISNIETSSKEVVIKPNGRFDFSCHKEFRQAYSQEMPRGCHVILDMTSVEYMDSSALGMLLMMREHLSEGGHKISIHNCQDDIRNVLQIANYEKLFNIV